MTRKYPDDGGLKKPVRAFADTFSAVPLVAEMIKDNAPTKATHPCQGMTKAQIAAFEQIAINQPPQCKWDTLDALLKAGVVERGESEKRRDAIGTYEIPNFYVPLPVHMQWCEWCAEQPGMEP